jgi:ribosomal protein L3 glutamine methyltransferase
MANGMHTPLSSPRDFLRYAVSRFREAKLAHGHGTSRVIDEAAFIVLETLHLPVDDINPWLDAKLLDDECERVFANIEARVNTRKPAAYILQKAYLQGVPFFVDERVIVPRSFIAELLRNGVPGADGEALLPDAEEIGSVLDLCTGSGCLAILAAGMFPQAVVDATDISQDALDVAQINVREHQLEERVNLVHGDLFDAVKGRTYDLIMANPPYVAAEEVAAFPAEYQAEPKLAHLGGEDGLDLVRMILTQARKHLKPGGHLICEIGLGREVIVAEFPDAGLIWLDTEESEGEVFLFCA